jgi:hypothetical protein
MNNLNNKLRLLPIIGITLTIIGYLYLTYQTSTLNERKNVLKNEITELENIKQRHTNEAKTKDTIINIQENIISKSADSITVKQGEQLKIKFNEPIANHFTVTKKEDANLELAKKYELEGFNYLLQRDVNNAILSFRKSENSYNGFHMVYDIAFYLDKNKIKLSDRNSEFWKEVYLIILKDYSWKMPDEIKAKLVEMTK